MKRVLIHPPWNPWLENRMFTGAEGCVYIQAFALWRRVAAENGFALDTWDTHSLSEADCVWMMDMPRRKSSYEQARRGTRPGVPFVLQTLESPLLTPQNFVAANRRHFDCIVTFEQDLEAASQYFPYRLPNTVRLPVANMPFAERRCAVMLNSNRVEGYLAMRQPGLSGLPGVGRLLSGWKVPAATLFQPARRAVLMAQGAPGGGSCEERA